MNLNICRKKVKQTAGKTEELEPDFNSVSVGLKKK